MHKKKKIANIGNYSFLLNSTGQLINEAPFCYYTKTKFTCSAMTIDVQSIEDVLSDIRIIVLQNSYALEGFLVCCGHDSYSR